MRTWLLLAATLAGLESMAYVGTSMGVGSGNIQLVPFPDGKKSAWLWHNWPKLDQKWRRFSFAFVPENDGMVMFHLEPAAGEPGVPFHYRDVQVNGVPVPLDKNWVFKAWPRSGGKTASALPSGLRLYFGTCAECDLPVKKGEKVEISLEGKSGSVLEFYADQLEALVAGLGTSLELDSSRQDAVLAKGLGELAAQLQLAAPGDDASLSASRTVALALAKACRERLAATTDDLPQPRAELRAKLAELARLETKIKTQCLLAYMLSGSKQDEDK